MQEVLHFNFEGSELPFEIGEFEGRMYGLHRDQAGARIIIGRWNPKRQLLTRVTSFQGGFLAGMKSLWNATDTATALLHVRFCIGHRMP